MAWHVANTANRSSYPRLYKASERQISMRAKIILILISAVLASCQSAPEPDSSSSGLQFDELTANSLPPFTASDIADAGASNGSLSNFSAFAQGHWVEYSVYVKTPGTYSVALRSQLSPDSGKYQLYVDGLAQGNEVDQYAATSEFADFELGKVTFLKPGYKIFRFEVTGKNDASSGYALRFDEMVLDEAEGFTLVSPNRSYTGTSRPVLRWNAFPGAVTYQVYVDGNRVAEVSADEMTLQVGGLHDGKHDWHVVSVDGNGNTTRSNILSFTVGGAPDYAHRDFSDDFASGDLSDYSVSGMGIATSADSGNRSLEGSAESGIAYASVRDISLEKIGEGEVSAAVNLGSPESKAGIGFRAEDGTFIYALADVDAGTLSIQRRVQGYSILDERVTPYEYQITDWADRDPPSIFQLNDWSEVQDGDWYVWTMDYAPIELESSKTYEVRLSFSRRAMAVMAELRSEDGSLLAVVRDMSDLRVMDHPAVIVTGGSASFDDFSYKRLDANTTNWDPDTAQVVLRPTAGTWDEKAAMNPAVIFKDDLWHMIYRGQVVPTPGDVGKPHEDALSEIGYATSTDGIHWTKHPGNPVIPKEPASDSIEDPDLLVGDDGYYYADLRDHDPHDGETLWRSKDLINWEHVADIPRPVDDHPGLGWKIGALLDTHTSPKYDSQDPQSAEVLFDEVHYRYLAFTERGRIMVTNDLDGTAQDNWKYLELYADFNTRPRTEWAPIEYDKMCVGDAFYDADGNIRLTVQATPDFNVGGQPECTNLEIIVDGNEPWQVLHTARLPYLQGYYGRAVTGVLDEYTAWDGSTFPGSTVEKDDWLWQYSGANNTFVSLIKAYNRHLFDYRNLTLSNFAPAADESVTVSVVARNVGNVAGTSNVELKIDGVVADKRVVSLEKNEEKTVEFVVSESSGTHSISVGTASATMVVDGTPLAVTDTRPNIILVMTDDQGWGQTGYNNHAVLKTPNLDEMATAGLRFDRFYAGASVCSPTRASVLTGRSNDRAGVQTHGYALRLQERTVAQALRDAGYATAHFGKWHLDGFRGVGVPILEGDTHSPGAFGFDVWLSTTNYFDIDPLLSRNGEILEFEGDSSEVIVTAALEFIAKAQEKGQPFFAVIWDGSPHNPYVATDADRAQFGELEEWAQHLHGELVAFDRSIGVLRQGLRDMNLADNTLVWYTSDNGGSSNAEPDPVGGLRGRKGDMWEGGLRVPGIIEWPAKKRRRLTRKNASSRNTDMCSSMKAGRSL